MEKQLLIPSVVLILLGGIDLSFAPPLAGLLQVNILPTGAVATGAKWSVDGPLPVHDTGTSTAVAVGIHTVYFTTIGGWTTAADGNGTNKFIIASLSTGNRYFRLIQ